MHQIGGFLPFILIIAVFWLLVIRPQRRRQAEQRATQQAAQAGTLVVLTSGIYGTIKERTDDHVLVEIADGVTIKVVPAAIGHTVHVDDESDESSEDTAGDTPEDHVDGSDTPDAEES